MSDTDSDTDPIDYLMPESTATQRSAALSMLLSISPIDRERALKKAAKKLEVSFAAIKAEFKAVKDQADAEAAAKKLKDETHGEDWEEPDLERCLEESRDLLPVCVVAITNGGRALDAVRKRAEEAGRTADFKRVETIAAEIAVSKGAWESASEKVGRELMRVWNGGIVKLVPRKDADPIPVLVASPLIVCAEGSNGENTNPHLRLKVLTRSGEWNEFTLAKAVLVGGGNWQTELLRQGLKIGDPETLLTLLKTVSAPKGFTLFERAGWNGEAYVLPNGDVIGPDDDVETAFRPLKGYEATGEKEEADARIFKLCENNSRLELAVCAALAAPFMKDMKVEAGGFHFCGLSGSGRTTTVRVGASVWGSGADAVDGGTVGSWRATDNGVEADAAVYGQLTSGAGIGGADQEGRVVNRFALCAAVGELAIKLGILPWTEGAAIKGVSKCFADWLDARGHGHLEALTAQGAFSQFVFSQGHRGDDRNVPGNSVRERAFVRTRGEDGKLHYWLTPDSLAEAVGQPQRVQPFLGMRK